MSNKKLEENDKMDTSTVYTMFEEVKDEIKGLRAMRATTAPVPAQASAATPVASYAPAVLYPADRTRIEALTAKIDKYGEKMEMLAPKLDNNRKSAEALTPKIDGVSNKLDRPQKLHHIIDFMGNKALIALVFFITAFGISLWINCKQWDFRDNDLKYRYIKMRGEAAPGEIERLETIFDYDRNTDSIRNIRRRVEQYERLVKETAEKTERARLNESEAKRLKTQP